ncbi:hypothetical protein MBLNU13_g10940t1 [Cladosporium sp. NU13]
MAALEKLPNELIDLIFASAPDIHTAVSLSATNRWLNEIWLEDSELFAIAILKPSIIAYLQAVDLAIAEERLEGQLRHKHALTTAKPPVHHYAARLLHNDQLAKSAAAAFHRSLKTRSRASHPQAGFQSSLLETLRTSSVVTLQTNAELALYLGGQADHDERVKHGTSMPEEDWPIDQGGYAEAADHPGWDYAGEVAHCALVDYLFGPRKLEPTMNAAY